MNKIKTYIFAGLLVWLPIGLTLWLIHFIVLTIDEIVPKQISTEQWLGIHIPGSGLLISLLILILTGIITKNMLGQRLLLVWEKIISSIPIVKSIYKSIKQVSDTLLSSKSNAFRKAVLIKFPHNNAYTIAFITGRPNAAIINNPDGIEYLNVYVPTTPNPTSGYFIMVPKADTQELQISVEQALRYVISMGTIDIKIANPTTDHK